MSTTELATPNDLRSLAEQSNAWPFEQAKAIVARLKKKPKDEVLFETGYGPSGLPHIGTFGEVARTTMVRTAFRLLTEDTVPTRLICFSDDMDGFRKVPGNIPNQEEMRKHLNKPLTSVPDPGQSAPLWVLGLQIGNVVVFAFALALLAYALSKRNASEPLESISAISQGG